MYGEGDRKLKLTEKDLDVVETVDGNAFLETPIQYTIKECKQLKAQILQNQEKIEKLCEFLEDPLNNPESHGVVFHNPEYGKFLKELLDAQHSMGM